MVSNEEVGSTMRERKNRDLRIDELVATAERLFYELGYDNCSINRIVSELKLAKATFFYFFPTKEAVLDEIIRRKCCLIMQKAKKAAAQKEKSRECRFLQAIFSVNEAAAVEGLDVTEHIHASGNSLMHQKIMTAVIQTLTPVLTEIVMEDAQETVREEAQEDAQETVQEEVQENAQKEGIVRVKVMLLVTGIKVLFDEACFSWEEQERAVLMAGLLDSAVDLFGFDKKELMKSMKEMGI